MAYNHRLTYPSVYTWRRDAANGALKGSAVAIPSKNRIDLHEDDEVQGRETDSGDLD